MFFHKTSYKLLLKYNLKIFHLLDFLCVYIHINMVYDKNNKITYIYVNYIHTKIIGKNIVISTQQFLKQLYYVTRFIFN